MPNHYVKTCPCRRVVERDLPNLVGKEIIKALVGKYLGPGWQPRVSIHEFKFFIEGVEQVGDDVRDWFFYYKKVHAKGTKGKVIAGGMIAGKDLLDGIEGGIASFWIADPTIPLFN